MAKKACLVGLGLAIKLVSLSCIVGLEVQPLMRGTLTLLRKKKEGNFDITARADLVTDLRATALEPKCQ